MIAKDEILDALNTSSFGKVVYAFESIDSTNTFARTLAPKDAPHGTLVIAEEQTAGKGRRQRQWVAAKGKNLLFTLVLYPDFSMRKISLLPFAGALAVTGAIERMTQLRCVCKWPNDVLVNGKKICGMLLESAEKRVVFGIGVNVNQEEFPDNLLYKASSLRREAGDEIDRIVALKNILEELEHRYEQLSNFPPETLIDDWKKKTLLFGKKITVLESEYSYTATALDVAEDGSLIIQTGDGVKKHLYAGDVSLAYD